MEKKIKVIPPTRQRFTDAPLSEKRKRRTCGYARVSTDHEEQQTSYEAQMKYYKSYIEGRDDLEFVGMYSDDGVTATSTSHRHGFNQMIEDALSGKIDLILTKSVSRFARNTVDSLSTIRKLKEHGIECYFEKENIWTFDSKGELLITIMSSLAQEESRSISENTTWGHRRRFADGRTSLAYGRFLGYGPDFEVIPEQADTVRLIYKLFMEGLTGNAIAKRLTEMGIPTPAGKKVWRGDTVLSILRNEKYKGDALLQKYYTEDFLTKKLKKNEGEIQQYYVKNHHEAIVTPEQFDIVQAELRRREGFLSSHYSGATMFSSKIVCGSCGGLYGPKVWHSNDKYRKVVFRCNRKYEKEKTQCRTPHLTEEQIKAVFVKAFNKLLGDREGLLEDMAAIEEVLCSTEELEARDEVLTGEIKSLTDMMNSLIGENASRAMDQTAFGKRYSALEDSIAAKRAESQEVEDEIDERNIKRNKLAAFSKAIEEQDAALTGFDGGLWAATVEKVTVFSEKDIRVTFRNGAEVKTGI